MIVTSETETGVVRVTWADGIPTFDDPEVRRQYDAALLLGHRVPLTPTGPVALVVDGDFWTLAAWVKTTYPGRVRITKTTSTEVEPDPHPALGTFVPGAVY